MKVIVPIILLLVGLGAGFFGGFEYRNYQLQKSRGNFAGGNNNFQRFNGARPSGIVGNGAAGRGGVSGSIVSMDDKSITVKMQDGSTKIVILSDSTTYNKSDQGSKNDLKVGENVAVFGQQNSDGSVTAQNIQLNPQFRGGNPSPSPASQ